MILHFFRLDFTLTIKVKYMLSFSSCFSHSWQVPENSVEEDVGLITANLVLNGEIEKNIDVR